MITLYYFHCTNMNTCGNITALLAETPQQFSSYKKTNCLAARARSPHPYPSPRCCAGRDRGTLGDKPGISRVRTGRGAKAATKR